MNELLDNTEVLNGDPDQGKPKPKFNPNKPYSAVQDQPKPKFDPRAKFEPVSGNDMPDISKTIEKVQNTSAATGSGLAKAGGAVAKGATQAAATGNNVQIENKPLDEFFGKPAVNLSVPATEEERTGLIKLGQKAQEANENIINSLHANDALYEKLIREDRANAYTIDQLKADQKKPGKIFLIEDDKKALEKAKKTQYDRLVTPEDISDAKMGVMLNEAGTRNFLNRIGDKKLMADAYLVDKHREAANDPNGHARAPIIAKQAKEVEKGKLNYDPESGILTKPESFYNSLITSWHAKNKAFSDYDKYASGDKAQTIAQLEHDRKDIDPDKPIPVPEGGGGKAGALIGGNPLSVLLSGGIAAAGVTAMGMPEAAPEAAKLASSAVGAHDFYKMTYGTTLPQAYNYFRNQGLSEEEAYDKANSLAHSQATTDAVTGAVFGGVSFGNAFNPSGSITAGFKTSIIKGLTQLGETTAKKALEGLGVGAVGATGQILKNIQAQQAGMPTDTYEGVGEQFKTGLYFTLGAALLAKSSKLLTGPTKAEIAQGLSKIPDEQLSGELNNLVQTGEITDHQAKLTLETVKEHRDIDQLIPEDIPEVNRLKIQAKIRERNILEEKIKNTDKAFHEDLKERVKKLNEDILGLAKPEEKSDNEKLIDKNLDKIPEVYQEAAKRDPDGFLKFIADQSFGRDESGTIMEGQSAEPDMRKNFGDKLVDKAKELYPLQATTEAPQIESQINTEQDALQKSSSGSILQYPQEGTGGEGGERERVESGQQGEVPTGTRAEAESKATGEKIGEPPPPEPPKATTYVERPATELSHRGLQNVANEFSLEDVKTRDRKSDIQLRKDAENTIGDWREKNVYPQKIEGLIQAAENGKILTDEERIILEQHLANVSYSLRSMDKNSPEFDTQLKYIKRLKEAGEKTRSEAGAALRIPGGGSRPESDLADYMVREMEASGVSELTEQQKATASKEFEEITKAKEELEAKLKLAEEENAKLRAESEIKKTKGAKKSGEKKDYKSERKDILEHMREQLKKSRSETSVSIVPYAKELIAIAPDVAKLVKSLVEEGIEKLPEIVKVVHDQLKELIPQITEKDVHNLIAGEYNKKKATRSETLAKINDLKSQAKLINRLQELEKGIEPKDEKKKIRRNREIEDLRKQIKEHDITKLSDFKKRTQKQISELEEQLKTNDFEPEEKKPEIKLDEEALRLKNKLIELQQEREKRLAKLEYDKKTGFEKGLDAATNILGAPRTIMASVDFSAPLRQGLVATISHPSKSIPAFAEMFKQAFSQKKFDRWLHDLKESPEYQVMEKSGLYIADPNNLHLSQKEETWMSNLAEKIPVVGRAVKGSERAYVAYLNKLRVDVFNQGVERLMMDGKTPENSPEIYKALGSFINNSTGRGELGKLEDAAQVLNTVFFSPRLIASRVNLLNPLYYTKLPKEIRIMALKDMAKTIGFGVTLLGLSRLAGADSEDDPRSPDFGKIKFGNTRYDIWGGFQQYVRVVSQLVAGSIKSSTSGKVTDLTKDNAKKTRADVISAFFRGKLAPVPGTIWDFAANKTVTGEKPTIENKAVDLFVPMIANDIKDAWKDQGFKSIFTVGIPSSIGVGISTYGGKPKH